MKRVTPIQVADQFVIEHEKLSLFLIRVQCHLLLTVIMSLYIGEPCMTYMHEYIHHNTWYTVKPLLADPPKSDQPLNSDQVAVPD